MSIHNAQILIVILYQKTGFKYWHLRFLIYNSNYHKIWYSKVNKFLTKNTYFIHIAEPNLMLKYSFNTYKFKLFSLNKMVNRVIRFDRKRTMF